MDEIIKLFFTGILSGGVISAIIGIVFKKKSEAITAEIKNQFEENLSYFKSSHQWKEKAIAELYGPLNLQFSRTKSAFDRYNKSNLYLEAHVLKVSNEKIMNLLLEKSYLIPPELTNDAVKLIEHYDVWLEEFNKHRNTENPNPEQKFIFAGPKGFLFPKEAEINFKKKYQEIWDNLYKN